MCVCVCVCTCVYVCVYIVCVFVYVCVCTGMCVCVCACACVCVCLHASVCVFALCPEWPRRTVEESVVQLCVPVLPPLSCTPVGCHKVLPPTSYTHYLHPNGINTVYPYSTVKQSSIAAVFLHWIHRCNTNSHAQMGNWSNWGVYMLHLNSVSMDLACICMHT